MTDTIITTAFRIFFAFGSACTLVFLAMMCADEFRKGNSK